MEEVGLRGIRDRADVSKGMEEGRQASSYPNMGVLLLCEWKGVLQLEGHWEARLQRAWFPPRYSNGTHPRIMGRPEDFEQARHNHGHTHGVNQKGLGWAQPGLLAPGRHPLQSRCWPGLRTRREDLRVEVDTESRGHFFLGTSLRSQRELGGGKAIGLWEEKPNVHVEGHQLPGRKRGLLRTCDVQITVHESPQLETWGRPCSLIAYPHLSLVLAVAPDLPVSPSSLLCRTVLGMAAVPGAPAPH